MSLPQAKALGCRIASGVAAVKFADNLDLLSSKPLYSAQIANHFQDLTDWPETKQTWPALQPWPKTP
jgi:hypothetical protein